MKLVFKIKTKPVAQATIIIAIATVSLGSLPCFDRDLFSEYNGVYFLLYHTCHHGVHRALPCTLLGDAPN